MSADPEMWNAFIKHLEGMIAEREAQIMPLRDGRVRSGTRGADTNREWVDTTDLNIKRLENEIAGLQHALNRVKNERSGKA